MTQWVRTNVKLKKLVSLDLNAVCDAVELIWKWRPFWSLGAPALNKTPTSEGFVIQNLSINTSFWQYSYKACCQSHIIWSSPGSFVNDAVCFYAVLYGEGSLYNLI